MDVNIDYTWMEESVKVIQWKNTENEKTNIGKMVFMFCLCASFLSEMRKKNEYNALKCEKVDNRVLEIRGS